MLLPEPDSPTRPTLSPPAIVIETSVHRRSALVETLYELLHLQQRRHRPWKLLPRLADDSRMRFPLLLRHEVLDPEVAVGDAATSRLV